MLVHPEFVLLMCFLYQNTFAQNNFGASRRTSRQTRKQNGKQLNILENI